MMFWPHVSDLEPGVIYTEFAWLDGSMLAVHLIVDAIVKDNSHKVVYGREIHFFDEQFGEECTSIYFVRRANKTTGLVDKCIDCTPGPKFWKREAAMTWLSGNVSVD